MDKFIGFKKPDGSAFVCPCNMLPDILQNGEAIMILSSGADGYKVANSLVAMGIHPQMQHLHAHIKGKSRAGRPSKPVQCVETGQTWLSVNKAATEIGAGVGNLSNHLRYPSLFKSVKGHTFKFI